VLGVESAYSAIEVDRPSALILVPIVALAITATLGLSGAAVGVLIRRSSAGRASV
jgi:hypothetical protein